MSLTLGSGWEPRQFHVEPAPDPTLAILEAVALLREGLANLPVPVVHVEPQDLTDIVTAVAGLHGPTGPSASDIAAAVREALAPSLEREEPETTRKILEALERLDFRMKGQAMSGVGGTVASISSVADVVRTKPEPGYTWPVSGTVTATTSDIRSLTERMLAKAPQVNYSLYLDTADSTYIYLAEGPTADTAASTTAQGIRVVKDASGNPLGRVQIATGFAWDSRSSATWA